MSLRLWDERVVPRLTDASLRGHEVGELRGLACAGLTGRGPEIGVRSGVNRRGYPRGGGTANVQPRPPKAADNPPARSAGS